MAGDETSPPRSYQVSVLDFPAELLGHIFLFLDQQTLLAVSLTNKSFHELCTCVLYRDIDIVHTKELVTPGYNKLGPHAGEHLARSIRKNPELAKHLRELHFAEEDSTPVSPAMEILPRATSLRKLTLLCGWKPVGEMTREGFESVWSMLLGRIRGRLDNLEACKSFTHL